MTTITVSAVALDDEEGAVEIAYLDRNNPPVDGGWFGGKHVTAGTETPNQCL
ncbi:hypothetical protein [Halalkalirubrum salinum]|uniref:hypothetical protein n=1 Tax=Halalkalirubrum salinum TaxID=2563889 RepID=UPI0014851A06|nr:hypothetical protein [Halalkalirubrum salinum]